MLGFGKEKKALYMGLFQDVFELVNLDMNDFVQEVLDGKHEHLNNETMLQQYIITRVTHGVSAFEQGAEIRFKDKDTALLVRKSLELVQRELEESTHKNKVLEASIMFANYLANLFIEMDCGSWELPENSQWLVTEIDRFVESPHPKYTIGAADKGIIANNTYAFVTDLLTACEKAEQQLGSTL